MISPFRYLYSRVRQLTPSRMTRRRLNRRIARDTTDLRENAASVELLESRKLLTLGGAITLSGNVYVDQAKTGSFIPGEGLGGVTVTLTQVGVPNFSQTTTTQNNGSYSFPGLQNGQYIISVTQPTGYLPGTITPGATGEVIVNDHTLQTVFLRSTTSLNYANNNFGELLFSPTINTTPNQTNVNLGSTQPVLTDTATLAGGYNESGTITFTLLKGSTVVDTEIVSVNGNGTYTTPTGYVLPAGDVAGNYQWNAVYSGDSHNNSYSDLYATNERVTVNQANPALSTEPNIASMTLGPNSQILKDVATLSGGYNPTGTITFTLFNGTTFVDQEYVSVTGNGTYTAPGYTLPSTGAVIGTYQWNATYSGDNNNRSVTDNYNPNERTVVKAARPTISTVPHPDSVDLGSSTDTTLTDTATLSGGYNPTGTITFILMNGSTVLDTEVVDIVPGVLSYTTPHGYVLPTAGIVAGTYQWNALYSGDSNNESASETGNPNERVEGHAANPTLTTTPNPIQTTLGSAVPTFTDTATLSGSYFGTGTITFTLFHQGILVDTEIVEVHGDGLYTTPGYQLPTTEIVTGDYQWNATYSGDPNNNPAFDIDNENERVYVSAASPTIRTTPTPTVVALPSADPTLMDTAILSGGYNETGTLTFILYHGSDQVYTETVDVHGNGSYTTVNGYKLPTGETVTGTYQWQSFYSGDGNNNPASETDSVDERVEVISATPTITTVPGPAIMTLGAVSSTLTDTATLSGGFNETGTITFTLYYDGHLVHTEDVSVHGNGQYTTADGYTLPTSGAVAGLYQWNASYSGDGNNASASETNNVNEQVTVNPASPSIWTEPGTTSLTLGTESVLLTDSAVLQGGYYQQGSITFTLTFNGTVIDTEEVEVSGDGTYTTPFGYLLAATAEPGIYQWNAAYSGDANNQIAVEIDNVNEQVTVNPRLTSSLSGYVYADSNTDNSFNGTDRGLANILVTLTGTDGLGNSVYQTTYTDDNGFYSFLDLITGTYTVTASAPGYLDETANVGSQGSGTASQSLISSIELGAGVNGTDNNFGELTASLSGKVYLDQNDNNLFDASDIGLEGIVVTLTASDGTVQTAVTDSEGNYSFTGLLADRYTLTEEQPAGYFGELANTGSQGTGLPDIGIIAGIDLGAGVNGTDNNFGELLPSTVAGVVFVDSNNDGMQETGEDGIVGALITLTGTDDLGNSVQLTAVTTNDGSYIFNSLRPGTYTLTETQPVYYLDGQDSLGTQGGTLANDVITNITLASNVHGTGNNFGELSPSSLAGVVYFDLNNNGAQDGSEYGIQGVTVTLEGTDDLGNPVSLSTTTAPDGSYHFDSLRPGTYTLTESQPANYLDGLDQLGTAGGVLDNDVVAAIVLGTNTSGTDYNFGEIVSSRVTGVVYVDANNNGQQDSGEVGIEGATVTLTGTNDLGSPVLLTTLTNASGVFVFDELRPGTYTLTETQPPTYLDGQDALGSAPTGSVIPNVEPLGGQLNDDQISNIVLGADQNGLGGYFGELPPSSLSGFVYADSNNDGVKGSTEAFIGGVTITLIGTDDRGHSVSRTTTTSLTDGSYTFGNLRPGTYKLIETQPGAFLDGKDTIGTPGGTTSNDQFSQISLAAGVNGTNNNFGELTASSLSGYVYVDANNDGLKGSTEAFVGGVTIALTGTDDLGQAVSKTTTSSLTDGSYNFGNLRPGTYTLTESQPGAFLDGKDTIGTPGGTTGNDQFSQISLASGVNGVNNNFGELAASSLSGYVYVDANNDGLKGSTEAFIGGVTITLTGTDDLGQAVSKTTTSSLTDGSYSFGNLRPGTYKLIETQPGAYLDGKDTIGTPGGTTGNDQFSLITLAAGVNGTNNNFGELTASSLSGYVYVDANNDGLKGSTEAFIGGVTVTLTGTDDLGQAVSKTTTSSLTDGSYNFGNLRPGTYTLIESQPGAYLDGKDTIGTPGGTTGNDQFSLITLAAGVNGTNNNFGELTPSSLSGYVYADANNDGVKGSTEAIIGGVTITLTGTDDRGQAVSRTTTTSSTDGSYSFTNLRPGTYTLAESQPVAYLDGKDTIGTPGGTTSNDQFSQIALASGVNGVNNNFGELTPASLSGYVYVDGNNDGIKGSTEAIIGGVTVTLTGTNDLGQTVSLTTTTSSTTGAYSFSNLRPGTYKLTETQPAGYNDGKDTIGMQGGNATVNDVFSSIVLAAGVTGVNNNFGETVQGGSISGTKYFDVTGNGLTSEDTPLAGATIKLYLDMNSNSILDTSTDKYITSIVSGSDGTFSFANLPAGVYFIQEAPMAGYVRTAPTLTDYYAITVTTGSVNSGYKFDNAEVCDKTTLDSASIKYYINGCATPVTDLRGNVNAGDTVKVVFNVVKPGEEYSLVSYTAPGASFDANAAYLQQIFDVDTIDNATVGSHSLTVVVPNSFFQVDFVCCNAIDHFGPAGSNIFYSAQGRLYSADNGDTGAGVATSSSLSGYVYVDTNNNGIKETGETGISGVTVKLTGTDIFGNAVNSTATTGTGGSYNFSNLNASSLSGYTISPVNPNGYLDGKDSVGSIGGTVGNNSLTTKFLNTNTNATNYNFGELLGSLSGNVYADSNSNAKFDSTDSGLAGAVLTLTGTDVNGKAVTATTTSASNGSYSFTGLLAGTYTVTQKHVAGYTDELPNVGTPTGTASFIQGTSETISGITLTAGMVGTNLNFGELPSNRCVATSDTATIGYWQNTNGQNLIKALNGSSSSTALAKWLATTFPNLYGSGAGVYAMVSSNGTYLTNTQVAASYKTNFFGVTGQTTNAQVLAVALATYCTNSTLAGGTYASSYGFNVSSTGTGGRTFNVGSDGAAFGVANNTTLTITQLLTYTNSRATNGVLYAKDGSAAATNRNLANDLYSAINVAGDIV